MKETEKSNQTDKSNKIENQENNVVDIFPKTVEEFLKPHENIKIQKLNNFRLDFNNKLKLAINDFKKSVNKKL